MEGLSYQSRPTLRRPVLVAAFAGWNDAGEAATGTIRFLREQWKAEVFATIDPEPYFDFQAHRPTVELNEEGIREVLWPTTDLAAAAVPGTDRDAILLAGIEPSMRWPTFCRTILEVASTYDVEMVITLGALLAGRPHTRPIRVTGVAATPDVAERYAVNLPRYEGPTGIVGVLMDSARRAGIDSLGFWAWVPHYVQGTPSPKATLGLVRRLGGVLGFTPETGPLEKRAERYTERVDEAVDADPDVAATVEELERQADAEDMEDIPSGDELAAELERFLRDQPPDR